METIIDNERKTVVKTPHATVVIVNGKVTVMKICRPAYKVGTGSYAVEHEERDIQFERWNEFCLAAQELSDVVYKAEGVLQGFPDGERPKKK